jgi:PAS domain S-box-containing protein
VKDSVNEVVRILLVDDEPRNLDALESILDSSGCTLVRAQTADEALFAILHNDFAAIVLDIKMPGTDGLELAKLIKQRKRSEHVPILFLTAHSMDEKQVVHAYGVGGADFLSKPINPDVLRSKVAVFANLFRTTRALASAVEALNAEVAERQNAQELLRLAKEQLETRVVERTAELARANQEVRDNEERLRLALAVAQVATWEWDLTTGKMRWSADPEVVFGFPPGAFGPDSRISHAVHPDDIGVPEAALQRAASTGNFEAEYRAVRPDGSIVWIADRGRIVHDSNSNSTRILGVSVDLSKRKLAERSLRSELAERKRLEDTLRESDRRKDEFLATLAHELRNPLAPVRYSLKVLAVKDPATMEYKRAMDIVERQTQHMSRLIEELIDVNRISRNALELRKEPVELARIIAAAVETNHALIEQYGLELALAIPSEPIYLDADPVRLAQAFSNLLNNAAKYSKRAEGTGGISLTAKQEGSTAVIRVQDVGIGIDPALLAGVFEMFTQVGRSIGQSEGGLGIGLSLAKRLVEMHGGTIEALSEGIGKGSEFIVRLPVRETVRQDLSSAAHSSGPRQPLTRRRILIADDNPDVVESFEVMLRMYGHEVYTAFDGMEALEKAEQVLPDVIVLDLGMPRLNGYETARRIRERPWSREIVLIAITGWGNDNDKRRSSEAGFNVHLVKPVDATRILECLDARQTKSEKLHRTEQRF